MRHPIVVQMSPSPEQEPAVRARGRDVVVTAGAGTGKTRTLVARYLSLLAEGLPLRGLVAITFTKKAAREMRNRVRQEVRGYLERTDLAPDERARWRQLYADLDAARISTIHSLCSEILRAHPAEADVDPRFEVLDEGQLAILRNQALDETLAWAADTRPVVELFALLGERGLRGTLETLLGQRLDAQAHFGALPADPLAHWSQALSQRQQKALEALLDQPAWINAVSVLQENAAHDPEDRMEIQRQGALGALQGAVGSLAERLASLADLDRINLVGGRQNAWPDGKPQLRAVKEALRTLRDLWRDQADILALSLTPLDETLAQALPWLQAAFDFACQRYQGLKEARNALDFDDLEGRALALLWQNETVRARWQEEVAALLVDEFQDTNGRQRDLVKLLNGDRGRLFIVGDAKQSIYRFRGADVTVFRAERGTIEAAGGAVIGLDTSYRAHRALVAGLNDLLRPVLGETPDPDRPWAEPFAPLAPHREAPGPGLDAPHVELHLCVGPKTGGALERAADALAGRIAALVASGAHIEAGGRLRPLGYGDVAILCRASTSFGAYEDALERAGVPFLTVAGRGFYGRPEVRDLLNGLQALADPSDDLALAGLLRSPALALSDLALYRLCRARDQEEGLVSLWDALQSKGDQLPGQDRPRARRAIRLVRDLHEQVGRAPVADLLKAFLDETDYRAALIQAGGARGARNLSKLLADAHASGIVGVGEFLEYVGGLRDSGTREGEARASLEGVVQIMSVHAAKGLEFPVVVVGDVTKGVGGRRGVLIDPELGALLPLKDEDGELPAAYRLGKSQADDQEEAESDRLLYVAATRAREKLLVSGCIGLRRDGTPSSLGSWLGKIAGPDGLNLAGQVIPYDEEGGQAIRLDLAVGGTPVACTVYEPGWLGPPSPAAGAAERATPTPLPPPLLAPVESEPAQVDPRTAERERIPPQRVWRVVPAVQQPRAPAWVVGSVVHEALAAWRFPDEAADFERWAEARARGHGLTDTRQLADAGRQSRRLLARFRSHPLYQAMEEANRRLHEVPYSLLVNGQVESGTIDALYRQGGSWTIVEFKTDRVEDEADLERVLGERDYLPQTQRYVQAMERLLGERPRCILCMLNYANTVHLHRVSG